MPAMYVKKFISLVRKQHLSYYLLAIAVWFSSLLLTATNPFIFQRFFGETPGSGIIVVSIFSGFLSLLFLISKGWFSLVKRINYKESFRYIWLILIFVVLAILVDLSITFAKDMNVPLPESLLFYPVIAFVVEILFHVLPLTLLLLIVNSFFKTIAFKKIFWLCIVITALIEPTYQATAMISEPLWSVLTIWFSLFFFNMTQLIIFKKYGFIMMYLSRILYYALWHILWGYYRLDLLF